MRKFWPFSFYFLYYAAIATYAPYTVLYLQSLDYSGTQIGILMGILPLITLVSTPFWTGIADRTDRHRLVTSITMLIGIGCLTMTIMGIWIARRRRLPLLEAAALATLLAGAIGNVGDRILRGYVVDFIYVHYWPIFNVADICLVVGAGVMVVHVWRAGRRWPETGG